MKYDFIVQDNKTHITEGNFFLNMVRESYIYFNALWIPDCMTTAFGNNIKFREKIQIVGKGKAVLVDSYSLTDFLFTVYFRLDVLP